MKKPSNSQRASAKQSKSKFVGDSPIERDAFPIVGIGASAGGLKALESFFAALPTECGVGFVVVPHLDPKHKSLMVELLRRHSPLPVNEICDGDCVQPDRVYVIPPNKDLLIRRGILHLQEQTKSSVPRTAIDLFFESLAIDQGPLAIGIVMSGTGSYGALGLREINRAGGMTIAQDPHTAEFTQMPLAASTISDLVLPPAEMFDSILSYAHHPYIKSNLQDSIDVEELDAHLNPILDLVRARTKSDFNLYRKNMIRRRIARRMSLIRSRTMAEYHEFVQKHPEEAVALRDDMLIGVTSFFRNPSSYDCLRKDVIPAVVARCDVNNPVRAWIPGCSTGEEVYTIGMLILEEFANAGKPASLQIFGSDVDERSIEIARRGEYPDTIAKDVSSEHLGYFFNRVDDHAYRVTTDLRDLVVFAVQNLISDAPFSRLDIISCRNLLIYLEPELQEKLIALFHSSLNEGGYLMLGSSESLGSRDNDFLTISQKHRIFQRTGPSHHDRVSIPLVGNRVGNLGIAPIRHSRRAESHMTDTVQRILLQEFVPACLVVNEKYQIRHVHGSITDYLEMPSGPPTQDALLMARQGLRARVRATVSHAFNTGTTVTDTNARVKRGAAYHRCSVTATPLPDSADTERLVLLVFKDRFELDDTGVSSDTSGEEESVSRRLEDELLSTREDLATTISELDIRNAELQSNNEEMISMNEELQSANEELETSKEELQSFNEELTTVNHELTDKLTELERASSDIDNLLTSSDLPILFLDSTMRVTLFTPQISQLLFLTTTDIGRPISHFATRIHNCDFVEVCRHVLETQLPHDTEVETDEGRWFLRRIRPYTTQGSQAGGVVATFVDITERLTNETETRRLAAVLQDSNDAVTVQDFDGSITHWNQGAHLMYGYTEAEALGMNFEVCIPKEQRAKVHAYSDKIKQGATLNPLRTKRITKDGRELDVLLTLTLLRDHVGVSIGVATTERDITAIVATENELSRLNRDLESRLAEGMIELETQHNELIASQAHLESIVRTAAHAIVTINESGLIESFNTAAEDMFGYRSDEVIGSNVKILMPEPYSSAHDQYLMNYRKTETRKIIGISREVTGKRKDGTVFPMDLSVGESKDPRGRFFVGIIQDITERKLAQEHLLSEKKFSDGILAAARLIILVLDPNGNIVTFNRFMEIISEYALSQVVGRNWFDTFLPERDRDRYRKIFLELLNEQNTSENINPIITKSGAERIIRWSNQTLRDNSGNPTGILATGIDITERLKLERRVLEVGIEEKQRIGRELHDSVGQELAGLKYLSRALSRALENSSPSGAATASEITAIADKVLRDVATLIRGLAPVDIDENGLINALELLAKETSDRFEIDCTLKADKLLTVHSSQLATQLYRIAQEAVTNAAKHAGSDKIEIQLSEENDLLLLSISDNGCGVSQESIDNSGGMGLKIMRHRCESVSGHFEVGHNDGMGTRISCAIDLDRYRGQGI